jgi:hypothetical protein
LQLPSKLIAACSFIPQQNIFRKFNVQEVNRAPTYRCIYYRQAQYVIFHFIVRQREQPTRE